MCGTTVFVVPWNGRLYLRGRATAHPKQVESRAEPRKKTIPPAGDANDAVPNSSNDVKPIRHEQAKRKSIPPAKLAPEGTVPPVPKATYLYSPRLPPVLRFDPTGAADRPPE